MIFANNELILFQGDSITDASRNKNDGADMGRGYAMMVASWLSAMHPARNLRFLNRGMGGNRVKDLQARWEPDCLELKPHWVSILIGINDCWRRFDHDDPTSLDIYEKGFRDLLTRIKDNGSTRLILCEPFVLPHPKDREAWREDLDPKIDAVRRLAREFGALLVPFDGMFAQAAALRDCPFWAGDGVHPTQAGHALMAQGWLRTVGAI